MIKAQFSSKELASAINEAEAKVIKRRKAPKLVMSAKSSKGFKSGTSGFSMGYPKADLMGKFCFHKSVGHY